MTAVSSSPPISQPVFRVICIAAVVVGFILIRGAYRNPVLAATVLLVLSFGMVNVLNKLFMDRWVADPSTQYPSFFYGDIIFLPLLTAVPLSLLLQHTTPSDKFRLSEQWWWTAIAAAAAIAISLLFWTTQKSAFDMSVLEAPDKWWHDRVVYPLFAFYLISAIPALWESDWGIYRLWSNFSPVVIIALLPFVGAGLWAYAGAKWDRQADHRVDSSRAYNWQTGEVSDRLILQKDTNGVITWQLPPTFSRPHS